MRDTPSSIPTNEPARLSALTRYRILDTPPEAAFDDIARLAALICQTPMALITLVDKHRQWFKAAVGIKTRELPRECSFCAHAINRPTELMVVPDATADPRFSQNPLVQGAPHVRFYAGAPLVTPEGLALGALCVVDRQSRSLTPLQQEALRMLAGQVMSRLEQRRFLADLALRLETAQHLAHVGDWQYDVASGRHDWSGEIFRILGVARKTFAPHLIGALACVHPEDRRRMHKFENALRTSTTAMEIEHRIVRPDGQVRHVRTRAVVTRGADGQPQRFTGTLQDITESKLAGEALHQSEQRYQLVSRATSDVLWDWNLTTNTLWRSEGFGALFGFAPDEIEPGVEWLSTRLHPEDRDRVINGLHQAIDSGREMWADEYRFKRKDNAYAYVRDRGYILRNPAGKGIRMVGGMTDLTERKKIEAQFLRAQRMESIGTLAGGIAHDLNNVLAPILLSIDLLKLDADDDRLKILDTIRASAQRGSNLVRQVLAFARGFEGQRAAIDLRHLVDDLARIITETFPPKINLVNAIPSDLWAVIGDSTQLQQLLLNLAVNARDAMPEGGTLTFAADNLEVDAQHAGTSPEAKPGPYVVLAITDTGTGMPPEIRDRIFEPFFTTKEVGRGTGLGLSTVHAIVKSHGGFLNVNSEVGHGTTFKIFLPADPAQTPDADRDTPIETPRGRGELVLVVDDEASIRSITRQTLEAFGYRVLTADDGAQAVAVFAQHRENVALVLIDMAMPVMDGPTAIHALLRIQPDLRIIAASGLSSNVSVGKAAVAGVKDFLPKPYSAETMLQLLREVLDRPATPAAR
ncbi:MAG: PAS domain-containing protein [Opitutaceae bacterium]|nr:PAS domain-containing protein [Opitutaceae bacterium]